MRRCPPTGAGWGRASGSGCWSGDQRSEPAQRLLVGEQFAEEFPERFGGWVLSAPQGHLSLGLPQGRAPAKWRSR